MGPQKKIIGKQRFYYSVLWCIDKKGGTPFKIAEGIFSDYNWIDDDNIYYRFGTRNEDGIKWHLFTKNIRTGKTKMLPDNIPEFKVLSEKELLYFKKQDSTYEIGTISMNNFSVHPFTKIDTMSTPSISKDGKKLVYLRKGQIWTLDLTSLRGNQITRGHKVKAYPIWIEDDNFIIYSTGKELVRISATDGLTH
jgi:hypothetical protein